MSVLNSDAINIQFLETVEARRSADEALAKSTEDLEIRPSIVDRYAAPSSSTPFPLEYAYHLLGDATGKRVLDYGCGAGENSVLIAKHGGIVTGVDISPELMAIGARRMIMHGVVGHEFKVGSAHRLPVADESMDVVFGMAILHHLDLDLAAAEVFRVLRKGGKAIFMEPVRNSRVMAFVRKLIPYTADNTSPFERPLTDAQLEAFGKPFSQYRSRSFSLPFVNLIEVLGLRSMILETAYRIDGIILRKLAFLRKYATIRVIEITK